MRKTTKTWYERQVTDDASKTVYEAKWTAASRRAYHAEHPENFAGPDMDYPIKDASDVEDAWNLAGHASNPDQVRSKIIAIAKRLGLSHGLPDTAKAHAKSKESYIREDGAGSPFAPKARIARIKVLWLEDGAVSLNNRQYPKEAVDALVRSAQLKLSDENAIPLTCYVNHDSADSDNTLELVGKVSSVWKEGSKAFAYIDIPDTRAGRDIASLVAGGYLRTESLRASNAKIIHDSGRGTPQVSGDGISLDGIDFTTVPGLSNIARIQNTLLESSGTEYSNFSEFFTLSPKALLLEAEKGNDMNPNEELNEANVGGQGIASMTSGESPSVTSDPTQDSYGQRMYELPDMTSGPIQGMEGHSDLKEAVKHAHDHAASALKLPCAPAGGAAEAGRVLNAENRKHLESIHKKSAGALNLECVGAMADDGMQDGDDDDQPDFSNREAKKEPTKKVTLTPNQLAEALRKAGYKVEAPKTEAQLLQERLEAQERQMAELKEALAKGAQVSEANPQRKSVVMGATEPRKRANMPYTHGSYLREQIRKLDWYQLTDRTAPLPEGIAIEHLIKEFEQIYAYQYDDRYGILSSDLVNDPEFASR